MKVTERTYFKDWLFLKFDNEGHYRLRLDLITYMPQVGDEFDFHGLTPKNQEQYKLDHRCSCGECFQRHYYVQQSDEHELKEEIK